jgi:hypothetical protein
MTENSIDPLLKKIIIRTVDESSETCKIFFKILVRYTNRMNAQEK